MKTREQILNSLRKAKKELQTKYKLKRMALFGSFARGDQTERSDVDVLVEVDASIGLEFVTLAQRIETIVGLPTDVISLRALKPRYLQSIQPELIDV